ncbi:MAG: hypothetical protein ACOY99_05910 [Pseudomonadota bacterium]
MVEKAKVRVRLYRRRNVLKDKVAGLAGGKAGNDAARLPALDPEVMAQAEKLFEDMAEDYPDWVSGLITQLSDLHHRCVDTPEERRPTFERIAGIAHDMKGQGGTFGYPLITEFASSLYDFANLRGQYSDNQVEIIKAHIDAMRAVIRERVSGDGGELGAQLAQSLKASIEKYKA